MWKLGYVRSLSASKSLAEAELLKASADVSRTAKALEEQVDVFEKKKLQDVKSLLLGFVTIELGFHSKAIELFTKAYQDIADINEDEDLEVQCFKYKYPILIANSILIILHIKYILSLNVFPWSDYYKISI